MELKISDPELTRKQTAQLLVYSDSRVKKYRD